MGPVVSSERSLVARMMSSRECLAEGGRVVKSEEVVSKVGGGRLCCVRCKCSFSVSVLMIVASSTIVGVDGWEMSALSNFGPPAATGLWRAVAEKFLLNWLIFPRKMNPVFEAPRHGRTLRCLKRLHTSHISRARKNLNSKQQACI